MADVTPALLALKPISSTKIQYLWYSHHQYGLGEVLTQKVCFYFTKVSPLDFKKEEIRCRIALEINYQKYAFKKCFLKLCFRPATLFCHY